MKRKTGSSATSMMICKIRELRAGDDVVGYSKGIPMKLMDGQLHKPFNLCSSHKRTLVFHTDMPYAIILKDILSSIIPIESVGVKYVNESLSWVDCCRVSLTKISPVFFM